MSYRVLISSTDEKGLVYKISSIFYNYDLNILSNSEFVDKEKNRFFMRSVVSGDVNAKELKTKLESIMPENSDVKVISPKKKNIVILATKESHALGDILIRYEAGELDANILGVVSNYDLLKNLVEKFDINYKTISHENLSREEHEAQVIEAIKSYETNDIEIDTIVLAKYMRILTPGFVGTFEDKIVNIHHSFLPAFIGANPYKQAFKRGVKIIGATAHFVNNDLDEGPIIAQDVIHVDHTQSWKEMQSAGRDVEKIVLSRALKLLFEDRLFVYGNKTVVF
jgi:formyltetrahydrofolate deformylase